MADILCIGSLLWDIIGRSPSPMQMGADLPGRITRLPGGVALNIAAALARLGLRPALLSAVGRDAEGDELIAACGQLGIVTDHVYRSEDLPTGRYMAVEGANGLIAAIADAHSLEAAGDRILRPLFDGRLGREGRHWRGPIVLDGNLTQKLLSDIAPTALFAKADLRIAPASPGKAGRLLPLVTMPNATIYLNVEEAGQICQRRFHGVEDAAKGLLEHGARRVLVTDGGNGCADATTQGILLATPPRVLVNRVTGAGDAFMAAHLAAETLGADRDSALDAALAAAARHVSGDIGT